MLQSTIEGLGAERRDRTPLRYGPTPLSLSAVERDWTPCCLPGTLPSPRRLRSDEPRTRREPKRRTIGWRPGSQGKNLDNSRPWLSLLGGSCRVSGVVSTWWRLVGLQPPYGPFRSPYRVSPNRSGKPLAPGSTANRRFCGRQRLFAASAKVPAIATCRWMEFAFPCGSWICDARLDVDVREADAGYSCAGTAGAPRSNKTLSISVTHARGRTARSSTAPVARG